MEWNGKMLKSMLACCKVYISESRNRAALDSIEQAAKLIPQAPIVNKFQDLSYNRVGYTVVSQLPPEPSQPSSPLKDSAFAIVKAAFEHIDLQLHSGTHPRLGVVDHICFHPLRNASLEQVAAIARSLAAEIGPTIQGTNFESTHVTDYPELKIWHSGTCREGCSFNLTFLFHMADEHECDFQCSVPAYLYGAAHESRRELDSIRRELGYFKPNSSGNQWTGGLESENLPLQPDYGPAQVCRAKGTVVIGTTNWVDNYNIPVFSTDMETVRRIAKRVSGRGGGLPSVQAMALTHSHGVTEVACNLLEPTKVGGERVQQQVEMLAQEEGLTVGIGYYTDLSQDKMVERYMELVSGFLMLDNYVH